MIPEWQQFLEQQGARIEQGRVTQFDDPGEERRATANDHVIADLSHYGLIRARDEEAQDFLQNQFSNDVKRVAADRSQLSAYCNPKGRILAAFRLFLREDEYYLRLPAQILPATLQRLRMFILRSKVTLDDASEELVRFGFAGSDAPKRLADILSRVPAEPDAVRQEDGLTILRLPGPVPRYEFHGETEAVMALWRRLARQARPVGEECWRWLTIQAGIPEIGAGTVEEFVPQMVNLAALDGVSFKKGCYPGQEVVARMHYLGKLKRRMYLAHVEQPAPPAPGVPLFTASGEPGVGKVVSAATSPEGGSDLLAVIRIASSEEPLHLGSLDGPLLAIRSLPYTVTDQA